MSTSSILRWQTKKHKHQGHTMSHAPFLIPTSSSFQSYPWSAKSQLKGRNCFNTICSHSIKKKEFLHTFIWSDSVFAICYCWILSIYHFSWNFFCLDIFLFCSGSPSFLTLCIHKRGCTVSFGSHLLFYVPRFDIKSVSSTECPKTSHNLSITVTWWLGATFASMRSLTGSCFQISGFESW